MLEVRRPPAKEHPGGQGGRLLTRACVRVRARPCAPRRASAHAHAPLAGSARRAFVHPLASAMPDDDNRSKQLNPQHAAYYLSRGATAVAAAAAAALATVRNQEARKR